MTTRRWTGGMVLLWALGLGACGGSRAGTEGQACRADQTCDPGLMCVASVCVSRSTDGGPPDAPPVDAPGTDAADAPAPGDGEAADAADDAPDMDAAADDAGDDGGAPDAPLDGATPDGAATTDAATTDAAATDAAATDAAPDVAPRPPTAEILEPRDGATYLPRTMISFLGRGRDYRGTAITGAGLVWTSSLDGRLGTGEALTVVLSNGMHTVTLTATDSGGRTGTASIRVSVTR